MSEVMTINRLIKRLFPIPTEIKMRESVLNCRRARTLAVLLLTTTSTGLFWSIALTLIYFIFHYDMRMNVIYAYFVSIVFGLQTWTFYRYANIRLASMLFSLTYFLMALSLVLINGGYQSPNLVVLLSSPVVSFCIGGKDEGITNSFFVFFAGLALMAIDKMGMTMANLFAGVDTGFLFSMAWAVTLAIIASCMVTYNMDDV